MENTELRNRIAEIPVLPGKYNSDDNLFIALVSYFERLPECPGGGMNEETGWNQWAMDQALNLIDRIIEKVHVETSQPKKGNCDFCGGDMIPVPTCNSCGGVGMAKLEVTDDETMGDIG